MHGPTTTMLLCQVLPKWWGLTQCVPLNVNKHNPTIKGKEGSARCIDLVWTTVPDPTIRVHTTKAAE